MSMLQEVAGIIKAATGGLASDAILHRRILACTNCAECSPEGERLYRLIDGQPYCGAPRWKNFIREPVKAGCGCNLAVKVRYLKSSCPRGCW